MNDLFSVEETNLMCVHDTSTKAALIADLRDKMPDTHDPDMVDIYRSAIGKLEKISDNEFDEIGLYYADKHTDETED